MPEWELVIPTSLSGHSLLIIIVPGCKKNQFELSGLSYCQGMEVTEEVNFTHSSFLGLIFVLGRRQGKSLLLFGSRPAICLAIVIAKLQS